MEGYNVAEALIYTTLALLFIYTLYRVTGRNKRRLPPGPVGVPILGYLPFLTKCPHVKLLELTKKYGPVFSLRMGSRYVIILGNFQSIKEAFAQDVFMGRPPDLIFNGNKESAAILDGIPYREQRRFSLQTLKELGFGRSLMEEHLKEEISYVLKRIEEAEGHPILLRELLTSSVSNNIASLVFGKRMEYNDERRIMLDSIISDIGKLTNQIGIQSFLPWVSKILRFLGMGSFEQLKEALATMKNYVRVEVKEHQRTLEQNNTRDFIDGYLHQIEERQSNPDNMFIVPVLEDLVKAFFLAGSETVRITMEWILLTVAAFPDVQNKVHREIDDVIGRERFPTWADRPKMPFTEAVILEVMRWKVIVPINILRYTLEDTTLNSYFIPKHSYVIANLWAPLQDPVLWKHPDTFRPERFLSKDGKTIKKPEHFIPFSIGKRSCPGELFAQIEVFVYFTAFLQKFDVLLLDEVPPDFEGILGVSNQSKPQELKFNLRQ